MRTCFFFILLPQLLSVEAACQGQDTLFVFQSKERALALYEKVMEGTHHLYNGSEYIAYEPLNEEHPYFLTNEWTYSKLKYDGEWFESIPLLFDINNDKLITSYYFSGSKMELIKGRVDEFIFAGHHFINLKNVTDTLNARNGYHELLYKGNIELVARRRKLFVEKIEGVEEFRSFKEVNQYFCFDGERVVKLSNKGDVIRLFKSKKKEIKEFIRKQELFTSDQKENSIIRIVKFIDLISSK